MSEKLPPHMERLRAYLSQPSERNEDLALSYFRHVHGDQFKRQSDAKGSDGYVAGHFVLELKGKTNDWYAALFQGLAYQSKGLAFSVIVVAAKNFLAAWNVDSIPEEIRREVLADNSSPSAVGKKLARKYATKKHAIRKKAEWDRPEIFGPLFSQSKLFHEAIKSFEKTIQSKRKVRQAINTKNFLKILGAMKPFFDPEQPIKTVRAFYSMIYGPWDEASSVIVSQRHNDRATLGGTEITNLVPSKRGAFKEYVENHYINLSEKENLDDFFSRYDEALDAVDKQFRIKNGIFFTDLNLSKFVMWMVKDKLPNLGRDYLVIDPACGSGNLVTNWRSPLELRHKVVSEIEPELLYAVEQRMKGDQWHNGKFTVVPKVTEGKGLNFLDKSAADYIGILKEYLADKGQKPDKPLAFLCNPPYRSDDDQAAESISYAIDPSILDVTGKDGSSERYACFLAQMKLICKAAADGGLPGESVLLLFTKAAWLTKRPVFQQIRRHMLGAFEDIGGVLVNGKEFFDLKGSFPIAFTMWKFRGDMQGLDPDRPIQLSDLTWIKKADLEKLNWSDSSDVERQCRAIQKDSKSVEISIGEDRLSIKKWTGQTMLDFKRSRRAAEVGARNISGLPIGDPRQENKKAYGEVDGNRVGFMDDLTPCRTKKGAVHVPWFRLDVPFMDCRKTRCFSGPPDQKGYCATDRLSAYRMFTWYALCRTFAHAGYPMWADALEIWAPQENDKNSKLLEKYAFAISFAENECVDTTFPARNPVKVAAEIRASNPMTPLSPDSFWSKEMAGVFTGDLTSTPAKLVKVTTDLFHLWKKELSSKKSIVAPYSRPYFIGEGELLIGAGVIQIKDYATETNHTKLLVAFKQVQDLLKETKQEFYQFVLSSEGLNYFGRSEKAEGRSVIPFVPKTKFDHVLERRLALGGTLVHSLYQDKNFGRTKLTKIFYLADMRMKKKLDTEYYRQPAGPLDQRALYNEQIGLEPLALRHGYFKADTSKQMVRYLPEKNLSSLAGYAKTILGDDYREVTRIIELLRDLTTDQCEIVATLYACWNDMIITDRKISDASVINEFLTNWHPKKQRFQKPRLQKALKWMRDNKLVPDGRGKRTSVKSGAPEFEE